MLSLLASGAGVFASSAGSPCGREYVCALANRAINPIIHAIQEYGTPAATSIIPSIRTIAPAMNTLIEIFCYNVINAHDYIYEINYIHGALILDIVRYSTLYLVITHALTHLVMRAKALMPRP
jgi:hypothetical protein